MRNERWLGISLLVAAVLAVLVVNRVSGRDVAGEATAVALQPIPPVGSCLDTRGEQPGPVDCRTPHTAEVYQSWRIGHPPAHISDRCASGGYNSYPPVGADWKTPQIPIVSTRVSTTAPLGWQACVFMPAIVGDTSRPLSYVGQLSFGSRGTDTDPTPMIGACYLPSRMQVDCSTPHTIERIGLFVASDGAEQPAHTCAEFARIQVGSAAFTGPESLAVVTGNDDWSGISVYDARTGESVPPQICTVVAPRDLVGSVVGLSDNPLPYG